MNIIKLVTGGARSGKSSYALDWCENISGKKCFVATCPVTDPEMSGRISAHQEERQGRGWNTIEEQLDLVSIIDSNNSQYDVILIDCLTLWINNLLYNAEQKGGEFGEHEMSLKAEELLRCAIGFKGSVCFVTNEVGLGIVPDNKLARKYRDLVGRCNRVIAEGATDVVLVSCGIPLQLKPPKV